MKTINPKDVSIAQFHSYLLGAVAPRPIAFASTVDKDGNVNLSPFSFFNVFGTNPPVLVFSPSRRVRDNTTKHSLENVLEVPEVVINIVNFPMVEQMSLASTEYEKGVNEFVKSGFSEASSVLVKPPRVKEAPVAFECKVLQVLPIGEGGGSANLVICEVLLAHISEEILDENGQISPHKLDAVARMGGDWYCRAQGEALFEIAKPIRNKGIGVDNIPPHIRNSSVLTGNNLGRLGNCERLPEPIEIQQYSQDETIQEMKLRFKNDPESFDFHLHQYAKEVLESGDVQTAWKILLQEQE
ncbi:flavin reductase family protein [Aquiflexum gelatinilyticum]|uniref:Flavin reductase family protein n=1 Tax=Aquiflexum gelatinilyticum TaxID=2961943 RepID=A0A9X2P5W6_9BACT|nr:flavin reductase family protein [Aquiflexum gelatinilyticum]MCR9016598.1 flavin reductase family protein [Aquiflexum gelatinilyticum]